MKYRVTVQLGALTLNTTLDGDSIADVNKAIDEVFNKYADIYVRIDTVEIRE